MTNKVGIGVEAQLDTSSMEQRLNALGSKVAAMNNVKFQPFSGTTMADVEKLTKRYEQLLKISGEFRRRVSATGQTGSGFLGTDYDRIWVDPNVRARQMRKMFEYVTGAQFGAMPAPQSQPRPSGGGGGGGGGGAPGMAVQAAQAGLRAIGPAGSVAAGAIGTGMSSGFGAGLMGLLGGMLALGVGKVVSAAMERVTQAEDNSVALDRLKRSIGDVNVSFNALKAAVHGGADRLSITYAEAGQLAAQFAKSGNLSAGQYRSIGGELEAGVGLSRAYGLDPSQGVGILGQMRGMGITQSTQESRRFALLIGETIGKSGAFAKADEVMDAIAAFATSQTRTNMSGANVAGYAGMFSALVGSGIPGLDPQGAAGLLSRVNSSLSAGGAKGEASQFFTALVGNRMGLDPIQTQILREGGAFATGSSMFGDESVYRRYMGSSGPGGDKTFLQSSLEELRRQYGSNKGLLAQATANHLGVGINQAMALLSVDANSIGDMQKYGDLGKLSASGIGNLSKALYGSSSDRQSLAQGLLGRDDVSQSHKDEIVDAMKGNEDVQREVLARISAQYDQERTAGSDIRDSKNALDNIKTNLADYVVPLMQEMRHGIMYIAGAGKGKTSDEVMREVIAADSAGRSRSINGRFSGKIGDLQESADALRARERSLDPAALAFTYRDRPDVLASKMQERTQVQRELAETEKKIAALEAERAGLLKKENERRDAEIKRLERDSERRAIEAIEPASIGAAPGVPGNQSISRRRAGVRGGGRYFSSPGAGSDRFDALFEKYGRMYGVDPALLKAIAMKESNLNPDAVGAVNENGTRDYGLMQHNSRYLADRGLTNGAWASPERSIEEAARLLQKNIQSAGSVRGGVRMYNGSGPRAERYADDVMRRWRGTSVGTPVPEGAGSGDSGGRFIFDAAPLEIIHKNERGDVLGTDRIATSVRPASPFGTERYA